MSVTGIRKKFFLMVFGILSFGISFSQQDTLKKKGTVDITSAFRPMLKESAKINFNASPALNDTTKPKLAYNIPNQNLLFPYAPGSLRPLALDIDSNAAWDLNNYIKAGFGNLKTPFVKAGISFGDGKTAGLNINARHISSAGKLENQDYRNTKFDIGGFFQTAKNLEWNAKLGAKQERYYKYGIDPVISTVPIKDSIEQSFQTWSGRLGFHNINPTKFNLSYSPEVQINVFNDGRENSESNTMLKVPVSKTVGQAIEVNLGATFDLTRYKPDKTNSIDNTFYFLDAAVLFKTPNVNLLGGIRPSWDNKNFKMLPNIMAEIGTGDKRFTFQAGWSGYIRRTSYQYLASLNPYIDAPTELNNTRVTERFAGFKGSVGDHFTYSTKLGYNQLKNQPLFTNVDNGFYDETFKVVYEPEMKVIHFGGELGYTEQEKFSLLASINLNKYIDLEVNDKAYGLIPLELKGSARYQVLKDLWLKSDLYLWEGAQYLTTSGGSAQLRGSFDLNAGVEFQVSKNLKVWADFNNIFNKDYEQWKLYRSYGFNFLAGVIFAFDQKPR